MKKRFWSDKFIDIIGRYVSILFLGFMNHFIFPLLCGIIGYVMGYCAKEIRVSSGMVIVMGILTLSCLTLLYYDYQFSRIAINRKERMHKFKKWYWALVGFSFSVYYHFNRSEFKNTYKENSFGIDQEQYIFLVNLFLFLILGFLFFQLMFYNYNIKNIGKSGITFEAYEDVNIRALETNTSLIGKIGDHLGALDEVVCELSRLGYVNEDISYKMYINLLERILQPIVRSEKDVYVQTFGSEEYREYMIKELNFPSYVLKKAYYSLESCGIINIENNIHIKYSLSSCHSFSEREVYIVMNLGELCDIKVGELLYGYLKCFEALFFKYI